MNRSSIIVFAAALAAILLTASCEQTPPEEFLIPEFEEICIDDSDPSAVQFVSKMSSMAQLTEYGLDYTDKPDSEVSDWKRAYGTRTGDDSFKVVLHNLAPGTTYSYRMFIGNGLDTRQSATNYYTTPQ